LHIRRELPRDLIIHILVEAHPLDEDPKLYKLREVVDGEGDLISKLRNPLIVVESLRNGPLFLLANLNFFGAISFGFLPSTQGANQNGVLRPFPRVIVVTA
jgi:hypothetical protein